MPRRVPKPTLKGIVGAIPKPKMDAGGTVRFSFKYAQVPGADPFSLAEKDGQYFRKVLERLASISQMPTSEFVGRYVRELRNHSVDFKNDKKLSVAGFTCLNPTLREEADPAAFQFCISVNEHGRIIGFIVGDIFFVVWFDHSHSLSA